MLGLGFDRFGSFPACNRMLGFAILWSSKRKGLFQSLFGDYRFYRRGEREYE